MGTVPVFVLLMALVPHSAALGVIDLKFTPVHLVEQSHAIRAGTLAAGKDGAWTLKVADTLKGDAADAVAISLDAEDKKAKEALALMQDSATAILFAPVGRAKIGYLHVGGRFVELAPAGKGWKVVGLSDKLSATYAGGTDMLIRMARYVLADPKRDVPVTSGVSFLRDQPVLGKVDGAVAGLHALELGGLPHLYVACEKGDRLFRAKKNDEAFDDVTEAVALDSRSKKALWVDLLATGQRQLLSWDGSALRLRQIKDGKFAAVGKDHPLANCLGLAACRATDVGAAVLVSTKALPFVLARDKEGNWTQSELPGGEAVAAAGEVTCGCIVADLDNDGYVDVLQPRSKGGLLWKGRAEGYGAPLASKVACAEAPGVWCLGDFDADGSLDIYLSDPKGNELWENDGKAAFQAVKAFAGSLSYRDGGDAAWCGAVDLNHDGRTDLLTCFAKAELAYHFNRGFRCLGEDGSVRVTPPEGAAAGTGQVAAAVWDFNGDGVLDLALGWSNGQITCHYNDALNKPMLRVLPGKDIRGPVTFSVWQGEKYGACLGTFVAGDRATLVPLRDLRPFEIRFSLPGKAGLSKKLDLPASLPTGGVEVRLEP